MKRMSFIDRLSFRYSTWRTRRWVASAGYGARIIKPVMITGGKNITLGERVRIGAYSRIECLLNHGRNGKLVVGDRSSAQFFFHCGAAESVVIGRDVWIGGRVYISDHDHRWPKGTGSISKPVEIGDRCWLGEGCAVLKGVTLGPFSVVGANAVVVRSAPAGSMLVGVPARVIKRYDADTDAWVSVPEEERDRTS